MKLKNFIWFAAAAIALAACEKPAQQPAKADAVEISAESKTLDNKGGAFSVIVTSTGDWTLTSSEDYSWVKPSATAGEDGDIVKFTVQPNDTDSDREAKYTFTVGESRADLTITSVAKTLAPLEIAEKEIVLDYNAGELNVIVSTDVPYRTVKPAVPAGNDWLKYVVTLPGDEANTCKLVFSYSALEGLDDRNVTVTVSGEDALDAEFTVLQEAMHRLEVGSRNYTAALEGETLAIPVTANVAYELKITSDVDGWISHKEKKDGKEYFEVKALTSGKRTAKVTLTQSDAKEGETPLAAEFNITQVEALISWAADMTGNRLYPKWEGGGPGTLKNFTLETLVYFDNFNKASGAIMTIMGIEGQFLLRMGDVGNAINNLQIATSCGNYNVDAVDLEPNRWYHIAVTFDNGHVIVYYDGEKVGEKEEFKGGSAWWPTTLTSVNLSPAWSYESSGNRCFWVGYSYENNRDTYGKMTEIRIWNKTLTAEEINAENHFYMVDPQSEGLFSYWKFVDGSGNTIADATGKGNALYGETNVRKQGSDNKGDAGIEWVEVALPDK